MLEGTPYKNHDFCISVYIRETRRSGLLANKPVFRCALVRASPILPLVNGIVSSVTPVEAACILTLKP